MSRVSRFTVGIDLGTTNTVLAYQTTAAPGATQVFAIEQLVSPGEVQTLPLLPSVRYHAAAGELAPGELQLPWRSPAETTGAPDNGVVVLGQLARKLGAQVPGRLVSSAKSWLSHTAVDRLAPILPWGAPADVPKVSPVQASSGYLTYVRAAWNARFPDDPLEAQELVLTVPASFDESARALTLRAATEAGLSRLRLLEEPQAAFYDWLQRHRATLTEELAASRLVLVCDVGGGTTDLSLIAVDMQGGAPVLTRIGVGKHLMLGGDNMDLALAHRLEARMAESAGGAQAALSASRMAQLMERCRNAKELLLAAHAPEQTTITLLGGGTRLVGGSRSVTLTRQEVEDTILDGFFPAIDPDEPAPPVRRGILEFGLPYAREPAITRHIASFLRQHTRAVRQALGQALDQEGDQTGQKTDHLVVPDTLLLNGGVFRAHALVQRLQHTLQTWRGAPLRLLHNDNPDVAVARGAVAYALAQRGLGVSIGGGAAHSYFLLLEDGSSTTRAPRGVCILPRGSAVGQELHLRERVFSLRVGQPVRFHVYSASSDGSEPPVAGQLLDLEGVDGVRLPPITTVLQAGEDAVSRQKIPVHLVTALTEVGTLELHCVSQAESQHRWLLEFDLRKEAAPHAASQQDAQPSAQIKNAIARIERIFGPGAQQVPTKDVRQLRAQLEQFLGAREQWPLTTLRQLFDALWQRARGRRRSAEHERVWLNLAGYCLRPGFGHPLDAWRMEQLWTLFATGVQFSSDKQVCAHWWTLWRRVAGGLATEQQARLLDDFAYNLQGSAEGLPPGASKPVKGNDADMLRFGAALERIPAAYKVEIGDWLLGRIQKAVHAANQRGTTPDAADLDAKLWALGRIGARVPFYGSAHDVVPADAAIKWVETLLTLDWKRLEAAAFAAAQIARMSDDRSRDLPLPLRQTLMQRLATVGAPSGWIHMVAQHVAVDQLTESRLIGESLPPGLSLIA